MTISNPTVEPVAPGAVRGPSAPRAGVLWAAVAVLGTSTAVLGAMLLARPADALLVAASQTVPVAPAPVAAAAVEPVAAPAVASERATAPVAALPQAPARVQVPPAVAAPRTAVRPAAPAAPAATPQTQAPSTAEPAPAVVASGAGTGGAAGSGVTQEAPAARLETTPPCVRCGVVESVTRIEPPATQPGVGALIGGVVGAVVGNQVGKGSGRTAATVIGAIGGGVAGHQIEKGLHKAEPQYEVNVRLDDGSLITLRQSTPARVGGRVSVEGDSLVPLPARPPVTREPAPLTPSGARSYSTT